MALPNPAPELSERELEILRLVATGASNKEIATRLVISPNTVKVHLRNVFSKVGASSRTEAAMYAVRAGLVEQSAARLEAESDGNSAVIESALDGAPAVELAPAPAPFWRRRALWVPLSLALLALVAAGLFWLMPGSSPARPAPTSTSAPQISASRWLEQPALPEGRRGMAAVSYENALYLVGGETPGGVSGSLLRLRMGQTAWESLPAKPTPAGEISAVRLGDRLYVPGGRGAAGQPLAVMEAFNLRLNRWEQAPALPAPRSGYALAAVEGRMYLFGGWDGARYTATVFSFDPASGAWQERSPLPGRRGLAAAATAQEGRIFIIGGTDGTVPLRSVLAYSPQRDQPGENPWEERTPLPEGRSGASAAVLTELIYVLGGEGTTQPEGGPPPLQYQPLSDRWNIFENAPVAVGAQAGLAALDTRLYVLGGQTPGGMSALHLSYQAIYTVILPLQQR
jgi:DNA-binding CsgD family transcriptional regulator/N-acetylneuraminic acid mutarotase